MEANLHRQENATEQDSTTIEYLKRQDSSPIDDAQRPSLDKHLLSNPVGSPAWNEISGPRYIEVGCLYEIDHKKLPPKYPIQLKAIRIVLVNEKTDLNVSVRFPSTFSLRTCFNGKSRDETGQSCARKMYPELDEQFVMRTNLARAILVRRISSVEFSKQKHMPSFWLEPSKDSEIANSGTKKDSRDDTLVKGICLSALKSEGLVHWGVRRRVAFMGRHNEKTTRVPSSSSLIKEEDEEVAKTEAKTKEETKKKTKKRKRESSTRNTKAKAAKHEKVKPKSSNINHNNKPKLNLSYERWSKERYNSAELKMFEIMKEKGAVFGRPILRLALRTEARKHIGDTGLLDHLLKHMAGKVVPNGEERFRRRHNAEGAMEYWLENADLVNIRRDAGVKDPYWTPPPGWKPGDSPSQDPTCASELKLLKEEMANIKRDVHELLLKRKNGCEEAIIMTTTKSCSNDSRLENDTTVAILQAMYENLLKKKAEMEKQLVEFSNSLKEMQTRINRLTSTAEQSARSSSTIVEARADDNDGKDNREKKIESEVEKKEKEEAEAEKAAKRQRLKSGFRICKPQGTFLWPNMCGSAGSSNILSPQVAVQVEDVVVVPTPPSVSSSTSSLNNLLMPRQPSSPVKPLAERQRPTVTYTTSTEVEDDNNNVNIRSSSSLHHHLNLNLNEVNNNNNNLQGFCGTPCSSPSFLAHRQRTLLSTVAVGGGKTATAVTYKRKQHQEVDGQATYGARTWLALATPSPR